MWEKGAVRKTGAKVVLSGAHEGRGLEFQTGRGRSAPSD
jgi:hypothetical protein